MLPAAVVDVFCGAGGWCKRHSASSAALGIICCNTLQLCMGNSSPPIQGQAECCCACVHHQRSPVGRTSALRGKGTLGDPWSLLSVGPECIRMLQSALRQHDRHHGPWAAQVFRKLGFVVRHPECEAVASAQPGAVERVLKLLRLRLEEYGELHPPTGCISLPRPPCISHLATPRTCALARMRMHAHNAHGRLSANCMPARSPGQCAVALCHSWRRVTIFSHALSQEQICWDCLSHLQRYPTD